MSAAFAFVPPAAAVVEEDMPPETAPTVEIDSLAETVAELRKVNVEIAELKEIAEVHRRTIEHALGEREVGLIAGRAAVTWKYVSSSRFDVTRFRKAHPDLAEEFLTESHSRRFVLRGN